MLVWLQHSDFSTHEFPDASIDVAWQKFSEFDWSGEIKKQQEAEQQNKEFSHPGIGLVRGDSHIIHLCPESSETVSVFYHYKQAAKALGLFPYRSSESIQARNYPVDRVHALFTAHYADDHTTTLALLSEYS